jgi:hypothetical protein
MGMQGRKDFLYIRPRFVIGREGRNRREGTEGKEQKGRNRREGTEGGERNGKTKSLFVYVPKSHISTR